MPTTVASADRAGVVCKGMATTEQQGPNDVPPRTWKWVLALLGIFVVALTFWLVSAVKSVLPNGQPAHIAPPDPTPRTIPTITFTESPCFLYMIEGNILGLSESLDYIPTFATRAELLAFSDARMAKSEAAAVKAMQHLASLEKRGTKVNVVRFDLISMEVVTTKGRAWIHPTWCQDEPPPR